MIEPSSARLVTGFQDGFVSLSGQSGRLELTQVGDRWSHAILGFGSATPWASSIDQAPGGDEPARVRNPVYQEAMPHGPESGASVQVLLTGRSFDHHFSAAVTLMADPNDPNGLILDVDVADRCRSPIESFSATYLVHFHSGALCAADPECITWNLPGSPRGRLALRAIPPCLLCLAEAGRGATRVQVLAPIVPGTFTHRLRYQWRWTTGAESTR